jgi:hypothetical protein
MEKTGQNSGPDGSMYCPGSILFGRINAARAAKNKKAFQIFLGDLSKCIEQHCQILRKGDVAELDAGYAHHGIHRSVTPICTTTNDCSSEESVSQSTIARTPNILPPSDPKIEGLPLDMYTTLLKRYTPKLVYGATKSCWTELTE